MSVRVGMHRRVIWLRMRLCVRMCMHGHGGVSVVSMETALLIAHLVLMMMLMVLMLMMLLLMMMPVTRGPRDCHSERAFHRRESSPSMWVRVRTRVSVHVRVRMHWLPRQRPHRSCSHRRPQAPGHGPVHLHCHWRGARCQR